MKRTRLKRKAGRRMVHRLGKFDPVYESWTFSVKPSKGRRFFNESEMEAIAAKKEAVVQDDVIDLYFTSKKDAVSDRKWLLGKGFRVTKTERE